MALPRLVDEHEQEPPTTPRETRRSPPREVVLGRSTSDFARLAVAIAIAALAYVAAAPSNVDALEVGIYRELRHVPGWLNPVSRFLVLAGSIGAVLLAAGVAAVLRRSRLAVAAVAAGAGAYGLAHISTWTRNYSFFLNGKSHSYQSSFPSDHMAVATALVVVAAPWLPPLARRLSAGVLLLVAVALDLTGHQLPLDLIAGAAIGSAAASAMALIVGAPGRSISLRAVQRALEAAGLTVVDVEVLSAPMIGPRHYEATTDTGDDLWVEVVRHGQRRAGLGYKVRRVLAALDFESEPRVSSPHHEVDHQALISVLAERAGVRTPAVVTVTDMANGPAMLVRRMVRGRRLPALGAEGCSDELLEDVWRQVLLLGEARISHHDLRASNVLVDDDGRPWLVDFAFAHAGATPEWIAQDRAEMLVSLASVVGVERAVRSAAAVVPEADLRAALVYLQPLALPSRVRSQLDQSKPALAELAARLATELHEVPPSFRPRVSGRVVISLALLGGAVFVLLPQLGTFPRLLRAVEHANYWWLAVAFLAGVATFPMSAISHLGSVRQRLPFWPTTGVQLASAFTSRITPGGLGGLGTNVIYLERRGIGRADAVGSVALNQAAGGVVHGVLLAAGLVVIGASGTLVHHIHLPTEWPVLIGVLAALVALGILVGSPFGRRRLVGPAKRVLRNLVSTLSYPRRALQLLGGSAGVTLSNAAALAASLAAFDPHFQVLPVMAVYVAGSAISAAAPTPGSLGAIEAALAAGLTGIGIASEPAIAAVLAFRLLTFWIPILPGLATLRLLQRVQVL